MEQQQIDNIINKYEKHKQYYRDYNKQRYSNDIEFKNKVKERSKTWYANNKSKQTEYYEKTKERNLALKNWKYAEKVGKTERYKEKYPELYSKYISQNNNPDI